MRESLLKGYYYSFFVYSHFNLLQLPNPFDQIKYELNLQWTTKGCPKFDCLEGCHIFRTKMDYLSLFLHIRKMVLAFQLSKIK